MAELTERQQRFVTALVETGGQDYTQCARLAGYTDSGSGAIQVAGWRLAHNPKVLAAIREMAELQLRAGALLGASAMIEIARDPMHKDRLKAADRLMERAGMLVVQRSEHVIEDRRETKEILAGLKDLAARAGIPLDTIIGKRGAAEAIDGEFTEVECDELGPL